MSAPVDSSANSRVVHRSQRAFGPIPEEKFFTVETLPVLVDQLTSAIDTLLSWGIRVPVLGRLQSAKAVLSSAAALGRYEGPDSHLAEIAESIFLAQDFHQITRAIAGADVRRLAQDLQAAMGGTVAALEPERRPYQYQSQLWFGAAMARGGLNPAVPAAGARHPDFLVQPGALPFGVEVKRPGRPDRADEHLSSARDQLASGGHRGVVVMDLTDALESIGIRRIEEARQPPVEPPLVLAFRELADSLAARVWDADRRKHLPGYAGVVGLCVALRGWRWFRDSLEAPRLFSYIGLQSFSSTKGNVWGYRAAEFFDLLALGLKEGGVHFHLAEYESADPRRRPYFEDWPDGQTGRSSV